MHLVRVRDKMRSNGGKIQVEWPGNFGANDPISLPSAKFESRDDGVHQIRWPRLLPRLLI